jgi:hypothetical protein
MTRTLRVLAWGAGLAAVVVAVAAALDGQPALRRAFRLLPGRR